MASSSAASALLRTATSLAGLPALSAAASASRPASSATAVAESAVPDTPKKLRRDVISPVRPISRNDMWFSLYVFQPLNEPGALNVPAGGTTRRARGTHRRAGFLEGSRRVLTTNVE